MRKVAPWVVTTDIDARVRIPPLVHSPMTSKVLILNPHAEIYRDRLRAEFPTLRLVLAHDAAELPADISDIDVLISFAIELKDEFYRQATRLKWVQ